MSIQMKSFLGGGLLFLLTACATSASISDDPLSEVITAGFEVGTELTPLSAEPAHDWWRGGSDPALAPLVGQAFAANRDLRVAAENVRAARAAFSVQRSSRRPTGEATAVSEYGQPSQAGGRFGGNVERQTVTTLGLNAAWELDFFGRVARLNEAAAADLEARIWERRDVEALVAAETARALVDLRSAETGIALTTRNIDIQRETLGLTEARFEEGLATRLDVARAEAQLRTTEALLGPFRADRYEALNRLATLTAQPVAMVAEVTATQTPSLAAPETLPLGDVEGLIRRRADIRRAEQELASAAALESAVRAEAFPRITLLGDVSAAATELNQLGGPGSVGFGIGPRLVWTGIDRPLIMARIEIAEADAAAALARYEQTVLVALEEVQGTFTLYGELRGRLQLLDIAVAQSRAAADLSRLRYEEGAEDFLSVLDAEARLLVAESDQLDAQREIALAMIDIYRALGAGWQE